MALSKVAVGIGAATGIALLSQRLLQNRKQNALSIDSEAAFPTAQLVAALRAKDAQSASPLIGSNIGGSPDLAAEALAGDIGLQFAKELGDDPSAMAKRTMFFDEQWMKAFDDGCKQFVILAAGLDARAWRLPRLDKTVKVFEVDVHRAMAYKSEKVTEIGLECHCSRIVVEADLSNPDWKEKLLAAGFDPSEKSFFLIEGLLMYLPQEAPKALFHVVSSLMQAGSTITGDSFVNCLRFMNSAGMQAKLAKYGTKWTFEFPSDEALIAQLAEASLQDANALNIQTWMPKTTSAAGNEESEDKVRKDADKVASALAAVASWPPISIEWVRRKAASENGAKDVIREIVQDKGDFQGLKGESAEHKAAICELLFAEGCGSKLEAALKELPESQQSMWWRIRETARFMYMMYRAANGNKSSYTVYVATKA